MPSPFLLIGCRGQVGWELQRTLAPLGRMVAVDYPEIDLASADSLRRWVQEVRPDVVINAAAYTAVDQAEKEPELAMKINAEAPGVLAEESRRIGAGLVHFSTDYVFDGMKGAPYLESDPVHPINAYGRSKLAGDQAVQAAGGAYLIFRLCWVYGTRGKNFVLTIQRLAREREELRVVNDQFGCPTWCRMIAEAVALALKQTRGRERMDEYAGVYHLCASGETSWHGFAQAIVERMPKNERKCRAVTPVTTAEYPTPARRPRYTVMSCEKLQRVFGLVLPDWRAQLDLALDAG